MSDKLDMAYHLVCDLEEKKDMHVDAVEGLLMCLDGRTCFITLIFMIYPSPLSYAVMVIK